LLNKLEKSPSLNSDILLLGNDVIRNIQNPTKSTQITKDRANKLKQPVIIAGQYLV
jgi:hypothetical protein